MLHIGGWCFSEPVEQGLQDLVDPVHSDFFSASLAMIRPIPTVT
jgi:hypothetical protein